LHHTAGGGTPEGIVNDWRTHRPGVGAQFIMDRDGIVHDVRKEFGYVGTAGILDSAVPGGMNVRNRNSVQMEIIAKDDKDVTDLQAQRAAAFIAADYPRATVYGHGQVNPGHRLPDEGQKARLAVEADRARRAREAGGGGPQSMLHMNNLKNFQRDVGIRVAVNNPAGADVHISSGMMGNTSGGYGMS
jgi:N-acetylmuramoyl-L-alanine amidase